MPGLVDSCYFHLLKKDLLFGGLEQLGSHHKTLAVLDTRVFYLSIYFGYFWQLPTGSDVLNKLISWRGQLTGHLVSLVFLIVFHFRTNSIFTSTDFKQSCNKYAWMIKNSQESNIILLQDHKKNRQIENNIFWANLHKFLFSIKINFLHLFSVQPRYAEYWSAAKCCYFSESNWKLFNKVKMFSRLR